MKQYAWKFLVAALCILALFAGIWYLWPRSAQALFPTFDWRNVEQVGGAYLLYEANPEPGRAPLGLQGEMELKEIGTPQAEALLDLLQKQTYRRALGNLLPQTGTKFSGTLHPGDFCAEVWFLTGEGELQVRFWFNRLYLAWNGNEIRCYTANQEALAPETLTLLREYGDTLEYNS